MLSGGERCSVSRAASGAGMCSVSHSDAAPPPPPLPPETMASLSKVGGVGGGMACRREKVKPLHLILSRLITMDCLKW